MTGLTHFDARGDAHMVDVSDKAITDRVAVAVGSITMRPETSDLIPLCHPLPITKVSLDMNPITNGIEVTATVKTTGQTGVEMEALTAVSIACLTIYDMVKAVEKTMEIHAIRLVHKDGGKSGRFDAS